MKKILFALPLTTLLIAAPSFAQDGEALIKQYKCTACHKIDQKSVGPSYQDIAKKYTGDAAAPAQMAERIKKGSRGVWGSPPMPPHQNISDDDIKTMINYIMGVK